MKDRPVDERVAALRARGVEFSDADLSVIHAGITDRLDYEEKFAPFHDNPVVGPLTAAMNEARRKPHVPIEEQKDLNWLRREVIREFENATEADDKVKFALILMKLLPSSQKAQPTDAHPDAALIEAVRKAVQGSVP